MQIPPNTALVNLLASLPAQGISAAPAAKSPQPAAPTQPTVSAPVAHEGRQPTGLLPRGSIINIIA